MGRWECRVWAQAGVWTIRKKRRIEKEQCGCPNFQAKEIWITLPIKKKKKDHIDTLQGLFLYLGLDLRMHFDD